MEKYEETNQKVREIARNKPGGVVAGFCFGRFETTARALVRHRVWGTTGEQGNEGTQDEKGPGDSKGARPKAGEHRHRCSSQRESGRGPERSQMRYGTI